MIRGLQACGLDSGAWCADGGSDDLPPDQRAEDGMSFCVEGEPLPEPVDLLGFARVSFTVSRTSRSRWWPCGSATSRRTAPRCW